MRIPISNSSCPRVARSRLVRPASSRSSSPSSWSTRPTRTTSYSDDVAMGEDGDFVVVWTEFPIESRDPAAGDTTALTTPLDGPFPVNADTTIDQAVASDREGCRGPLRRRLDARGYGDDPGSPLRSRRDACSAGTFRSTRRRLTITSGPHVASDPSGNFVVAWTSTAIGDTEVDGPALRQQRRAPRRRVPGEPVHGRASSGRGESRCRRLVSSSVGSGKGKEPSNGIFARLFDAAGNPVTDDLPRHTARSIAVLLRRTSR